MAEKLTALGLMSGTSADGIDAAILTTDGDKELEFGASLVQPYSEDQRRAIKDAMERAQTLTADDDLKSLFGDLEHDITLAHAAAVKTLLEQAKLSPSDIDVIGFHGQTILHRPPADTANGLTLQLGDGAALAAATGIDVVSDFRSADMAAGGHGAPLAPLYHQALVETIDPEIADPADPVMVVNIGGIANITYVPRGGRGPLMAFDAGPGNGLMDDWMQQMTGEPFDNYGDAAGRGLSDPDILGALLSHRFFEKEPPKSLDRHDFTLKRLEGLDADKGAATLSAFTACAISLTTHHTPDEPNTWIICGGGRKNNTLMKNLNEFVGGQVFSADDIDWKGDVIEAQAMAYLAVRSKAGLPLSVPGTTGVKQPTTGGVLHQA